MRRTGPSASSGWGFGHDAPVSGERAGHDAPVERDRRGTFLASRNRGGDARKGGGAGFVANVIVAERSITEPPTPGFSSAEIAVNLVIVIVANVVVAKGSLARLFFVDRMLRYLRWKRLLLLFVVIIG